MAGCAAAPAPVGPLPYTFQVVRVQDARPSDDTKLMSAEPFGAEKLIAAWQRVVARQVWGSAPADLDIKVLAYETTRSAESFAMSLTATLVASQPGAGPSYRPSAARGLAEAETRCAVMLRSTDATGGRALANATFGPQGLTQGGLPALGSLTKTSRDATLWQELWNQCTRQLANQFTQALLAGPPQAIPDLRGR